MAVLAFNAVRVKVEEPLSALEGAAGIAVDCGHPLTQTPCPETEIA